MKSFTNLSHVAVSVVIGAIFMTSCSSTTLIHTNDSNAKIYVDGEYRGKGSVTQTDQKIIGATTLVKIQKEGCEPSDFIINKSEEFQVGPCIGGVFVLVPFLWVMGYKPDHSFEYSCSKAR